VQELGIKDFDIFAWSMLVVRKETPPAIIAKLESVVAKALIDPGFIAALRETASEPGKTPPADVQKMVDRETAFWSKALRGLGIEPK
jgi:tripartite-type tricarboxylate transporter receptor subunit TctC